jgi:hypothetical protein
MLGLVNRPAHPSQLPLEVGHVLVEERDVAARGTCLAGQRLLGLAPEGALGVEMLLGDAQPALALGENAAQPLCFLVRRRGLVLDPLAAGTQLGRRRTVPVSTTSVAWPRSSGRRRRQRPVTRTVTPRPPPDTSSTASIPRAEGRSLISREGTAGRGRRDGRLSLTRPLSRGSELNPLDRGLPEAARPSATAATTAR